MHAGLTSAEAARRLATVGPNRVPEEPPRTRLAILVDQFRNPMVLLLAAAAGVSFAVGHPLDAVVILAIVGLNTLLGYAQEGRAEAAAREVRRLLAPRARVLRDGRTTELAADEVVPGDVAAVAAGDRIAADGRWIEAVGVEVDESLVTGEALPVRKAADDPAAAGTTATRGSGLMLVTATGAKTEIGRIVRAAGEPPKRTPLQLRLDRFAEQLLRWVAGVCLMLAGVAWAHGDSLRDSFLTGVSLAVAAVPEALPAVVTIALALGMRRLAHRGAIVRRLAAVETLGSTTTICTDKTGTLTTGRLALDRVYSCPRDAETPPAEAPDLLEAAVLAADPHQDGSEQADPLERAIGEAAAALGIEREALLRDAQVVAFEPFDPDLRRMSVTVEQNGRRTTHVKGAPEALFELIGDRAVCTACAAVADRWAAEGARVLMVAAAAGDEPLRPLGLLRLADPPRATASESVDQARRAGVRTVMVTGDHAGTARAVAQATGIAHAAGPVEAVTGLELERLDDDQVAALLARVDVFARIAPSQKVRLVRLLTDRGEVVAMTGDGVNDVPALRAAHIGVAMGRGGSDAAAAAADVVLVDDDYSTIVRAVRAGRVIFDDIRHFTLFLLAANLGEVVVFALAVGAGLSAPLTVLQILLVNLLTDGLPAVALAADPPERNVMQRPPRPVSEGLLAHARGRLLVAGIAVGLAGFAAFLAGRADDLETARTLAFTTLVAAQLLFVYSARASGPFWTAGRNHTLHLAVAGSALTAAAVLAIPSLRDIFGTTTIETGQLLVAIGLALVPFLASELYKPLRSGSPAP